MTDRRAFLSAMGIAVAAQAALAQTAAAPAGAPAPKSKEIHRQALPEPFNGWEARFVEVTYPAGTASPVHKHPGFVLGYVVEGEFRFAINNEEPKNLASGVAFYEPPGATHTASGTAKPTQGAKILAIIVAPVEKA